MLPKKQIDALVLPTGKYWLIVFSIIATALAIAAFFIFLGLKYHMIWGMIICVLLCMIITGLFVRMKINLIAKNASILFSEEFIEISGTGTFNEKFFYSDIKYFSASDIAVDKASRVNFIFESGAKRRYIFFRQLDNSENVLNNVFLYFSSYNIGKIQEEKIQMLPSFFVTKQGKLFVTIIGFIILATIVMQVLYKPKTIFVSVIAVLGAYMQIKSIQMKDKEILKKFLDEN
jgi:hypothetical protein